MRGWSKTSVFLWKLNSLGLQYIIQILLHVNIKHSLLWKNKMKNIFSLKLREYFRFTKCVSSLQCKEMTTISQCPQLLSFSDLTQTDNKICEALNTLTSHRPFNPTPPVCIQAEWQTLMFYIMQSISLLSTCFSFSTCFHYIVQLMFTIFQCLHFYPLWTEGCESDSRSCAERFSIIGLEYTSLFGQSLYFLSDIFE